MGQPKIGELSELNFLSSEGKKGVLEFTEVPIYPPYYKNGLLMLPLNRSLVLALEEVRGVNLPIKFPIGTLQGVFGVLPNRRVMFLGKTDG